MKRTILTCWIGYFVIRIEPKVPLEFLPQMARSKMREETLMGLFFAVLLGYTLTG